MHIICEHLRDLFTLNSLSGWKGLKKFIPRDSLNSPLIYILFSMGLKFICNSWTLGKFICILCIFYIVRSLERLVFLRIRRPFLSKFTCLIKKKKHDRWIWNYFKKLYLAVNKLFRGIVQFEGKNCSCIIYLRPNLKNLSRSLNLIKYGWCHIKVYSIFQDLIRRSIETGFWGDLRRGLNSLNLDFV